MTPSHGHRFHAQAFLSSVLHPIEMVKGRDAVAGWLATLGLPPVPRWHVEITLAAAPTTTLHIGLYEEEWGFAFRHANRASWIRVIDAPFVHGRDDFDLLAVTPELHDMPAFIARLEHHHGITLPRSTGTIRSNIPNALPRVRAWLEQMR